MRVSQKIKYVIIIIISLFLLTIMQMEASFAQEEEFEYTESNYISGQEVYSEEKTADDKKAIESALKNIDKETKEFSEMIAMQPAAMSSPSGGTSENATGGVYSKPQVVSVSQVGAAILSYPIEVPPGRNGFQPDISLDYSSYNGNGWLGVGWDLNMGSISRSTKNGVNYNDNEYVVDGSELVSRSSDWGSNYYGAKIEGAFTKYYFDTVSYYWTATAKDGTKYRYGYTSASRMTNTNGTYSWHLDRVEDTNGNYMTIEYTQDQNQIYPYRIYYTYHTTHFNGPNDYSYRVEFDLVNRADINISYKIKSPVTTAKRLKTITVKQKDGTIVYKHMLTYDNSGPNGRSRLARIQRVDPSNPNNTLPPYKFTYNDGGDGTFDEGSITSLGGPASHRTRNNYVVFGDINGDGIQDFIKAYSPDVGVGVQRSSVTVYPYLANGTGGFAAQAVKTLEDCPTQYDGVTSMSVALGDINGDGKADIVSSGLNNTVHVYLSNGNGTFSAKITSSGVNNFSNLLADINGDGKTDLVMYDPFGTVYTALSNGNGTFGAKVKHQLGVGSGTYDTYRTRIHLADFNGDGKADIFSFTEFFELPSKKGYCLQVYSGNGDGTFNLYYIDSISVDSVAVPSFWLSDETTCDINGDGLADIAYRLHFPNNDQLVVLLSTGTGMTKGSFTMSRKPTFADVNDDGMDDLIVTNYVYKSNGDGTFSDPVFVDHISGDSQMADINGDGRPDYCNQTTSGLYCAHANGETAGDNLKTISNPLGGETALTYGNSSGLPNNKMPFVTHPVKTIEAYDAIIEEGDYEDIPDVTTYDYANAYYDYAEKDSRGFGYVKQTNPDNTTIETTYEIYNMYKKGRPLTEVIKDAVQGTTLMLTNNNWGTYPTTPVTWAFVKLNSKITTYENNSAYSTALAYGYDNTNGFPVTIIKSGTNANGQGVEQVTQSSAYDRYPSNSWTWRLKQETVTGATTGLARKMTYNYDSRGNMLNKIFWRSSSTAYNSIDYGYDAFGNVISETDALERPPTTFNYDATYTFPVAMTNPKGHVTTKTWDYRFGKEDIVTDPNGNKTDFDYDAFGRLFKITNKDVSNNMAGYSTTDYSNFDQTTVFPRYITTKSLESGSISAGSYIAKEEYFDGLGRTIKVATDGINEQEQPLQILSTTHYDNMGRKSAVYGPYFANEGETSGYYEKTYYDKVGRVAYILMPSNNSNADSTINYTYPNPFTTVITDQDGKQKTEKRDHLGRIFEIIEHTNTGNKSTFYWYNAAGDMLEVENALGYSTLMTYDARGLKLTMDDPDMGYWTYTYDENGNLKTQTDTKSQVITFNYEVLNRVYQKVYTPSSQNNPTVTYTYDNAINGKGQLYSVANTKVTTTYNEYDAMGRVVSVTKTITGDQARTTETEYDLSGKVLNITHPDGFEVRNTYYPGTNLLNTVKGTFDDNTIIEYAKCTEYEPTGKIGRITHTYNDTETVYTYNLKTTRLTSLLTSGPAQNNIIIQNKTYVYSEAGDILNITDYSGPTPVTFNYQYDNLHRLLREDVIGDYLPATGSEVLIYNYDNPDHINAVSSIRYNGTLYNFTYDANGNMLTGPDFTNPAGIVTRTITWNADNMPVTVSRGGVTTSLTYDGDGARAKKVAGGITTYYISSDYEIKNGVATKYLFAGNLRVASVEGTNINNSKIFHKDHLGSSTAITDSAAGSLETSEYLPFGVMRKHTGSNVSDYKYTDQELDISSNLYNYNARLYDPVIGRFISADTIVQSPYNPQSLNRYSYVFNNPLIYTDPTGHFVPGPQLDQEKKRAKAEKKKEEHTLAEIVVHGTRPSAITATINSGAIPRALPRPMPFPKINIKSLRPHPVVVFISILFNAPEVNSDPDADEKAMASMLAKEKAKESLDAKPDPSAPIPDSPSDSPGEDWEWKGSGPPENGKGNWVNNKTGQKLHPDLHHKPPKGPHWGLTNPDGTKWDYFPGKGWQPVN